MLAEELLNQPIVLREPGSGTGKTVGDALTAAGISPERLNVIAYLGSNEAVKHAVLSDLGISFVSELSVRRELERNELAAVKVDGLRITRCFYLATRSGRELSPAAKAFATMLLQEQKKQSDLSASPAFQARPGIRYTKR